MSVNFNFVATCLFGLERLVGEEIDAIGCVRRKTIDGRVYFTGTAEAFASANINLRCAERVFLEIASFKAESFTELFDAVCAIPWETIIGKKDAFPVKGHSIKSKLFSIPDCQSIIKKAIVKRLSSKYGVDWFEETGVKYQVEFFILNDEVCIMIDTTGLPLHKRGYRVKAGAAPLRETLAAAIVKLSRPRENVRLWDPFCGSGTIPVEAAMIMTNTAPGVNRSFAAEDFPFLPKKLWTEQRTKANDLRTLNTEFCAYGSDVDSDVLSIARTNAKRAGMEKYIKFFRKDALDITKDDVRTTIVCNPPYGERLDSIRQARELYEKLGNNFSHLSPWQIYIMTSEEEFEKLYGKKADKVRKLYNGMIKCNLYQYFKNP